ncbi:MAG: hypothetical protein ACYSW8_21770 [Planctomycetota bacterium]
MARDLVKLGERLTRRMAEKSTPDLFAGSGARLDRMLALNRAARAQREQRLSEAQRERRARALKVERSKSPVLRGALGFMRDHAASIPRMASQLKVMIDPSVFLSKTVAGAQLKHFLNERETTSSKVLCELAIMADDIVPASSDVMIRYPVHAYLDTRDELFARLTKTQNYNNLIQKQERLLLRIGNTLDYILSQLRERDPQIRVFTTLWSDRVCEMAGKASLVRYTAPNALTIQLMETLIMYSTVDGIKATVRRTPRVNELRDHLTKIHPAKALTRSIARNADFHSHSDFFTNNQN